MKLGMDTRFRSALTALLCTAISISVTAQNETQLSRQVLHNHVRREVSSGRAALVGRLPSAQRMQLSIVLPLRNQTALTELIGRLYDPSSPDFRHFLSVDQFAQQFGPTAILFLEIGVVFSSERFPNLFQMFHRMVKVHDLQATRKVDPSLVG